MSGAQPERGVPRGNFYPGTGVPIRAAKLDQSSSLFANRRRGFLVFLDNSGKASPGLLIWIWLRGPDAVAVGSLFGSVATADLVR